MHGAPGWLPWCVSHPPFAWTHRDREVITLSLLSQGCPESTKKTLSMTERQGREALRSSFCLGVATPVFLPGKPWTGEPGGYSPCGCSRTWLSMHTHSPKPAFQIAPNWESMSQAEPFSLKHICSRLGLQGVLCDCVTQLSLSLAHLLEDILPNTNVLPVSPQNTLTLANLAWCLVFVSIA